MILTLPEVTPGMSAFFNTQRQSSVTLPVLQVQIMDWFGLKSVKSNMVRVSAVFGSANGSTFVDQFQVSLSNFMEFVKESQANVTAMAYGFKEDGRPSYVGADKAEDPSETAVSFLRPRSLAYDPKEWKQSFVTMPAVLDDELFFIGPRGQVAKITNMGGGKKTKSSIQEEDTVIRKIEI